MKFDSNFSCKIIVAFHNTEKNETIKDRKK